MLRRYTGANSKEGLFASSNFCFTTEAIFWQLKLTLPWNWLHLAITHLYEKLLQYKDNDDVAFEIFLDIAKAFDSVDHEILGFILF